MLNLFPWDKSAPSLALDKQIDADRAPSIQANGSLWPGIASDDLDLLSLKDPLGTQAGRNPYGLDPFEQILQEVGRRSANKKPNAVESSDNPFKGKPAQSPAQAPKQQAEQQDDGPENPGGIISAATFPELQKKLESMGISDIQGPVNESHEKFDKQQGDGDGVPGVNGCCGLDAAGTIANCSPNLDVSEREAVETGLQDGAAPCGASDPETQARTLTDLGVPAHAAQEPITADKAHELIKEGKPFIMEGVSDVLWGKGEGGGQPDHAIAVVGSVPGKGLIIKDTGDGSFKFIPDANWEKTFPGGMGVVPDNPVNQKGTGKLAA